MRTKNLDRPFELKSISDNGTFTGYASVFGELDWYREVVLPGAFKNSIKSLKDKGRKLVMLWQHKQDTPIGVYNVLIEDEIGLYVEGEVNMDVQQGREAHSLMKQRALDGLSIGINTVDNYYNEKLNINYLKEVLLGEISPVTFPAGDSARIATVKSISDLETLSDCEKILREAGFFKSESVAFVSRMKAILQRSDSGVSEAEVLKNLKNSILNIKVS